MNAYVAGGYGALVALLGLYAAHLRRRARILVRALPPQEPTASEPS